MTLTMTEKTFEKIMESIPDEERTVITERLNNQQKMVEQFMLEKQVLSRALQDMYNNIAMSKTNCDRIIAQFQKAS